MWGFAGGSKESANFGYAIWEFTLQGSFPPIEHYALSAFVGGRSKGAANV